MHSYIKHLKSSLDKEYNAAMKEKISFACILKHVEPVQNFYKITIQLVNKVTLKEEDKLEIEKNIVTILEILNDTIICKSKKIMSKQSFFATKCNENIKKIQKRFEKYVASKTEDPVWINNINETKNEQINLYNNKKVNEQKTNIENKKNIDKLSDIKIIEDKVVTSNKHNQKLENKASTDETQNLERKYLSFDFINTNLNQSQKIAVLATFENLNYKILGPPGTGKTKTILEIILQLLRNKKKVLVCGPSNASVDNILRQFVEHQKSSKEKSIFFRLGSSYKCFDGFEQYNLNYMAEEHVSYLEEDLSMYKLEKDKEGAHIFNKINFKLQKTNKKANKHKYIDKSAYKHAQNEYNGLLRDKNERLKRFCADKIKEANVVFSTLFSTIKIQKIIFDVIIIDECCQGTDIEVFLSMLMAKNFILAGDPFQLGPVNANKEGLYERLDIRTYFLDQQYRMTDKLIKFSNKYFYENRIKSLKTENEIDFFGEGNLIFVDTFDSYFNENEDDKSKYNREEALIIVKFVDYLQKHHQNISIGIITPYTAQADLLVQLIENKNIKISTVDSFQGQEKDVIIFSMVRSNEKEDIGFLEEIRRTNVAITRCKKGFFVVGNSYNFKKNAFYSKFVQFLYEDGFCIDPENFDKILPH